jgi:hypothetical protein
MDTVIGVVSKKHLIELTRTFARSDTNKLEGHVAIVSIIQCSGIVDVAFSSPLPQPFDSGASSV